jgi:L-arabinose isomerase
MLYGLARAELAVQDMPAAERHMREYLAKRDDDATAHFGLGRVLQISLTAEHLQDFADIAGIECLRIDAGTKVRDFVKELGGMMRTITWQKESEARRKR